MFKFQEFYKPFEVHTNAANFAICKVMMQDGWPIAYESKKLNNDKKMANSWKNFFRTVLLEDVATLFSSTQQQNVHKQYVLELFWDTNANECQKIAVEQYLGAYEYGFDPQTGLWKCGARRVT